MNDFSKKVVVILGATGNLGQACVETLSRRQARIVLVDRSPEALNAAFPALDGSQHMLAGGIDLSDEQAVGALVADVDKRFDRIDALINTVGAFRGGEPTHLESRETWDFMLNVNLYAALIPARAVVPVMLKGQAGRIIHVVSKNALAGAANYAPNSAAKAALLRMSESMAGELKAQNITVNCVIPGTIDTPQNRSSMPSADVSRWVSPEAIAEVIAFLASDAAHAVTGAAIPVYGKG